MDVPGFHVLPARGKTKVTFGTLSSGCINGTEEGVVKCSRRSVRRLDRQRAAVEVPRQRKPRKGLQGKLRKGSIIATCVLAPVVVLSGLAGLRMMQHASSHESKPVPASGVVDETADPYLKIPIPDPNSDVLFGSNARD